jgi:uncharacterized protein YecE (DUF72 family)
LVIVIIEIMITFSIITNDPYQLYLCIMNLYLGCPIWAFKGWVNGFTPRNKIFRLLEGIRPAAHHSRRQYHLLCSPGPKTVQGWVVETPETFRFCPKLPRTISHAGNLADHIQEASDFIAAMSQLGARLGPMFLQLPPRYSPRLLEDLQTFLEAWPRQVQLAVEVRHMDWFASPSNETLNELLANSDMARVVIDTRPIRDLKGDKILAGSVYQRLLEA